MCGRPQVEGSPARQGQWLPEQDVKSDLRNHSTLLKRASGHSGGQSRGRPCRMAQQSGNAFFAFKALYFLLSVLKFHC
jgi:hypothetical protein